MKIKRSEAVSLFSDLGLKKADVWDNQRMASKLQKLGDMLDEDVKLEPEAMTLLNSILNATKNGEAMEVLEDEEGFSFEEPATPVVDTAHVEAIVQEAEKEIKEKLEKKEKAIKEKLEKKEKAAEVAPDSLPKKLRRVRPGETLGFFVGQALKKHGVSEGVTDEAVQEYNKLRGKDDEEEAVASLAYGWHVINGFLGIKS